MSSYAVVTSRQFPGSSELEIHLGSVSKRLAANLQGGCTRPFEPVMNSARVELPTPELDAYMADRWHET